MISLCLSATGIGFLGLPVPAARSAFLAVGSLPEYPADRDGVSAFRMTEL